jgi:hypothetical protein
MTARGATPPGASHLATARWWGYLTGKFVRAASGLNGTGCPSLWYPHKRGFTYQKQVAAGGALIVCPLVCVSYGSINGYV